MANHPIRTRAARETAQGAKQWVTNNPLRETSGLARFSAEIPGYGQPGAASVSLGDGESKNLCQTVRGSVMAAWERSLHRTLSFDQREAQSRRRRDFAKENTGEWELTATSSLRFLILIL